MLPAIKKRRLTLLACLAALLGGCQAEKDACPTLTGPGMECWKGIGECRRAGHYVCDPERGYPVCDAVPRKPAAEVCDGLDNDCDGATDENLGSTTCGLDVCRHKIDNCTDGREQVCDPLEGASPEICDGLDNDCDGKIDEDFDADHDTYSTCGTRTTTGEPATADCDDLDPLVNPERGETCNGKDDDCDGETDEDQGNTICGLGACLHSVENCAAGQEQVCDPLEGSFPEACDGLDNDCNGLIDNGFDVDGDTYTTCGTRTTTGEPAAADCDDGNAEINPGMKDICNLVDDDCDGETDEQPDADESCDDEYFCNIVWICEAGSCKNTMLPRCPGQLCDENLDICIPCTSDADCDDGDECWEPICDSVGRCDNVFLLGKICDDSVECTVGICNIVEGITGCYGTQYEGSTYDDICRDGIDNDCDGLTDYEETDCCIPDCTGAECGDGGCRDQQFACGTCPAIGESCVAGQCRPTGLEWVYIPGGTFMMGSPDGVGDDDEHPRHEVTVPDFEMLKTEVTIAQYLDCVESGACTEPLRAGDCGTWCNRCNWTMAGRANNPVVCVNWYQAVGYCQFIGGRLPSEAEWEYAARSGGQDITYPWGDEEATCEYAVMDDYLHGLGGGCLLDHEWPVCSKPAGNTTQGLCDMAGNVWEFTQDWYHETYEGAPRDGSAWEYPPGHSKVIRGGSWEAPSNRVMAAERHQGGTGIGADAAGFRCVHELEP